MLLRATRWLVVLTASLVVLQGNVFATAPAAPKQACRDKCSKCCPCCISKPTPAPASAPLAPSPSRVAVEKCFQFVPLLTFSVSSCEMPSLDALDNFSAPHFAASLPVFLRHRAILI